MAGWLKLHRSITSSDVFKNPNVLKFWIWALCKASHVDAEQLVGFQKVLLQRGQFIFGRDKAAQELRMNSSSVYKYLNFFENEKMLSVKSNNKFSVVTIVNWDFYQGDAVQEEQQNNNKITTKKQQNNTNKNVKNIKKYTYPPSESMYMGDKAPTSPPKRFRPPSFDEVQAYCRERNNTVDPETFIDFYTSKGWIVGKAKMKDWKSAVRTWERNRQPTQQAAKPDRFAKLKQMYAEAEGK